MALTTFLDTSGMSRLISGDPRRAEQVLEFMALETAGQAKQNIRDVGAIDTSYMINTTRARRLSRLLWSIGTAAYYGIFIEFGTTRASPRPWLIPAMRQGQRRFQTALRRIYGGRP